MVLENDSLFRQYVVGVETKIPLVNGKLATYINFDNAATTPPLKSVIKAITDFAPWYSSIHRGKGYKSQLSSDLYEESRKLVAGFVKADPDYHTVIYVKNTTEAINKLSYRLSERDKQSVILSTDMEHHSNDLPWRGKFQLDYISIDSTGRLSLEDLEAKLIQYQGRVKLVTVTGASNVTGYLNPIYKIAGLAHQYKARILVDGAQLVPHTPIDLKPVGHPEHIDYLAFSGHKMYAPFGTGVLIGPVENFKQGYPDYVGGGTVQVVTHDFISWDQPPHKEEAGSPNIMGVVALGEAIKTLSWLGMDKIARYEQELTDYTIRKLKEIPDIILYNQTRETDGQKRVGIIPFNIKGMSHELVATILAAEAGIAVRNGCFCAQPYIQKLLNVSPREIQRHLRNPDALHPGLVRISFGMYNNFSEVDTLLEVLKEIVSNKNKYRERYRKLFKK